LPDVRIPFDTVPAFQGLRSLTEYAWHDRVSLSNAMEFGSARFVDPINQGCSSRV
jgi:hypothetical protein